MNWQNQLKMKKLENSCCHECAVLDQHVFSEPDIHLTCQRYTFESYQLKWIRQLHHFSPMLPKKRKDPWLFFTFRTSHNTGNILSRWCIHWPNCQFYHGRDYIVLSCQNNFLDFDLNCVNSKIYFSSNPNSETSLNDYCILIGCIDQRRSVIVFRGIFWVIVATSGFRVSSFTTRWYLNNNTVIRIF